MARFSSTMEFFLCILQVAVIAFGGFLIMRNQMDLVDLLTFSFVHWHLRQPHAEAGQFLRDVRQRLRRPVPLPGYYGHRAQPEGCAGRPGAVAGAGSIDVDHVSFSYDGDLAVLHNVDLHVQPGETRWPL